MTAAVQTLTDTPALTVWSSDGTEVAVWDRTTDPVDHGYIVLAEPQPFDSGLVVAEVVHAEAMAAELRAWHEALAS